MLLKAQRETGSKECKLVKSVPTRFASLLASFRSALENREALTLLYSTLVEPSLRKRLPSDLTWEIVATVYMTMRPVMAALISSQSSNSHCLLSTMLHKIIQLYVQLMRDEEDQTELYIGQLEDSLNEADVQKLKALHRKLKESIQKSLYDILEPFRSFEPKTSLYWLVLLIDPRFKLLEDLKDLQEVDNSFHIGSLVRRYEERVLYPSLEKCYLALNPSILNDIGEGIQTRNQAKRRRRDFAHHRYSFRAGDRVRSICKNEYLLFRDQEELEPDRCPLLFFQTFQQRFPTISYLAKNLLAVPSSQTSVERLFSVAGHLMNARRNRLKIENLDMVMMININLPKHVKTLDIDAFLELEIDLINEHEHELLFDPDSDSD